MRVKLQLQYSLAAQPLKQEIENMVSPVVIFFIILVSLPLICKFVLKLIVIHSYVKLYNFFAYAVASYCAPEGSRSGCNNNGDCATGVCFCDAGFVGTNCETGTGCILYTITVYAHELMC